MLDDTLDPDLDIRDYDPVDEDEALQADDFRAPVTGLPARPGTRR